MSLQEVKDVVRLLRRCGAGMSRQALRDGCLVRAAFFVAIVVVVRWSLFESRLLRFLLLSVSPTIPPPPPYVEPTFRDPDSFCASALHALPVVVPDICAGSLLFVADLPRLPLMMCPPPPDGHSRRSWAKTAT